MNRSIVAAIVAACLLESRAFALTTIDTTPSWNGSSSTGTFNGGGSARRAGGQTFVVGEDNILVDFTMFADGVTLAGATLKGYVMQWDGAKPVGPILYESPLITLSTNPNVGDEAIKFTTGGVILAKGTTYIAFLDAGDVFQEPGAFNLGITSGRNPYPNGSNFESPPGIHTFAGLSTVAWHEHSNPPGGDAAFIAHLFAVPEPLSIIFVGIASSALMTVRCGKRPATNVISA